MARYLGIAGVQMEVEAGEDNSERMIKKLHAVSASFPWVDIVVFSELCLCGLNQNLAKPLPNSTIDQFCEWAKREKKWLIPGSFYERNGDRIYNTALVIGADGDIKASYRKLFPWSPLEQCDPGEEFCIFDMPGKGQCGLCICYDQWFPEVIRSLAWMGAEAIFCPTATYTSDRSIELVLAQANGAVNQAFFFNVNGVGGGGIGQSIFVDPEGRVLQTSGVREIIMTEIIDLDVVSRVREYGTLGLSQLWKDLGSFHGRFPVYEGDMQNGRVFQSLGPCKLHRTIQVSAQHGGWKGKEKGGGS